MIGEKVVTVLKDGRREEMHYYVEKTAAEDNEFGCEMYAVGVKCGESDTVIDDFSPDEDEALRLVEYLYRNNITGERLFSAAEEFITES